MVTVDRIILTSHHYKKFEEFWMRFQNAFPDKFNFTQRKKYSSSLRERIYSTHKFTLSYEVTETVNKLSGKDPNNFFVCLHTAFSLLLKKYSGQSQVIVDTPLHKTVDSSLLYMEKVPLMLGLKDGSTLREVVLEVQKTIREFYTYQNYPWDKVLVNAHELFDTNISLRYHPIHLQPLNKNYDLSLSIDSVDERLECSLTYAEDCFEDFFIKQIPQHFEKVLLLLNSLDTIISEFSLLTDEEKVRIIDGFNRTGYNGDLDKTIQASFQESVRNMPDAPAVVFGQRVLTYKMLDDLSDKVGWYLKNRMNVETNDRVGISMSKSDFLVTSIMGILKAGGVYVVIDPKLPSERIEYILKDSQLKALITEADLLYSFLTLGDRLFLVDIQLEGVEIPTTDWMPRVRSDDPAYIVYTSGSTGQPKGVIIRHSSVINLAAWQAAQYSVGPGKNILQFFSYSFDGAVGETFMALLNGATLKMFDTDKLNIDDLVTFLNKNDISVAVFVPSLLKQIDPTRLRNLKNMWVVSVGEDCPPRLAKQWSETCTFANAYGPSEYTVYSHLHQVHPGKITHTVPVGTPMFNTKSFILDKNLDIVPVGIPGELYISGAGLFEGYLGNRRMTLSKVLPNRFFLQDKFREHGLMTIPSAISEIERFREISSFHIHESLINENDILTKTDVLKLTTGLDADLITASNNYLDSCEDERHFKSFRRYFLEGFNDTYASCGLNEDVFKELFPFETYAGRKGIDLGFGNGEVMLMLKTLGADVVGIELSPFAVQKARNKNLKAFMGAIDQSTDNFFESQNITPSSLDFSISNLLLDRVEHPMNNIRLLLDVLKEGGRFALQTLLPIIPVDDGDVNNKIVYTGDENIIVAGNSDYLDKLSLVRLLYSIGASQLEVRQFPYIVSSRDGVQEYKIWSFTGVKGSVPDSNELMYSQMYKTGDLAAYFPDGAVNFIGRVDDQIKIRGFRIELGEIEKTLIEDNGVKDVRVVVKSDVSGDKTLWAFYIPNRETPGEEIRKNAIRKLPVHMVPQYFIPINQFPLNNSGKLDKEALLALVDNIDVHDINIIHPSNLAEQKLHDIWCSVLDRTIISCDHNFFDLGGHSLKATQLVHQVHKSMGVKLDLSVVFEYPTIKTLAIEVNKREKKEFKTIDALANASHYELSHAQKSIWLGLHTGTSQTVYNIPLAYDLRGSLNMFALESAFALVISRHESLRTVFRTVDQEPRQFICDPSNLKLDIELRSLVNNAEIPGIINDEQHRVFDLEKWPLLVVKVLKVSEDHHILILNFHHIILDAWSMDIFVEEMLLAYEASRTGHFPDFKPLPIQYKDYAAWHNQRLKQEMEDAREYWITKLASRGGQLELLTDYERPAEKTFNGRDIFFEVDNNMQRTVQELSKTHGATNFCVLVCFLKVLLHKYCGQRQIALGMPVSGRDHVNLEGQIGVFLNMVPLVTEIEDDSSFIETLARVKETMQQALSYQSYPFEQIIQDSQVVSSPNRSPVFDIIVQMLGEDVINHKATLSELTLKAYPFANDSCKYDLSFTFFYNADILKLKIQYSTDLFKESSINRIASDLLHLIKQVGDKQGSDVRVLKLLSDFEAQTEEQLFMGNMRSMTNK